jgi:hypothetical protein
MQQGLKGDIGSTPNISIGTVSGVQNGTAPTVVLNSSSTAAHPILDFTLEAGITPQLYIGSVHSLPSGTTSQVSLSAWPAPFIGAYNINFGLEKGANGSNGSNGDATAATAAAVAAAGSAAVATAAAGSSAASSAGAAASASASAASAASADTAATTSATYARHFLASDIPSMETCNGILRVKDLLGLNTVHNLDQSGNYQASNSISVNPSGSSNVFNANSSGNVNCNTLNTVSNITANGSLVSNQVSGIGNGHTLNIGSGSLGSLTSVLNLNAGVINFNGVVVMPQSFYNSTNPFDQLGW